MVCGIKKIIVDRYLLLLLLSSSFAFSSVRALRMGKRFVTFVPSPSKLLSFVGVV